MDSFVALYPWHPKWNYYWWAYKKQAAHRLYLMDWYHLSYLQTFCSTSPRSVLCWAALNPFIFIENVLLSLFISLENTCLPTVDVEDSDPPSFSRCESPRVSAETHRGSVDYGWRPMLCMSIKSYLSGHWMLPSPIYTSESEVEKTMLWWWLDWSMVWASSSMAPKLLLLPLSSLLSLLKVIS